MMILADDIHIQCFKCNYIFAIEKNYYEPSISRHEHGSNMMGEEIDYYIEDTISCEFCGNRISFSIYGSEYPTGAFNHSDYSINGAQFIAEPQFEILYSPEGYLSDPNDYDRLETFLHERQIDTLYHFTRIENLENILFYGLLPRDTIKRNNIVSHFNDSWRHDKCSDANCLSLEFPNYKMFYKLRKANPHSKWIVLKLNIDILFDFKCAYCWTNAGDERVYNTSLQSRMSVDSLFDLYNNRSGYPKREETGIKDCYPTNPQAEVLVFDIIPIEYIDCIYFEYKDVLNEYLHIIPSNIYATINDDIFYGRSDYEYWRGI